MFGMGSGLTGSEGYQLGRLAARREQTMARFAESLRARFQPSPVDVNALIADNQALAAQNQALWNQVNELQHANAELARNHNILLKNYRRLADWADDATAKLRALGCIKEDT